MLLSHLNLFLQFCLPQHLASRLLGSLANCQHHKVKNALIQQFIKQYNIDLDEVADPNLENYANFNQFFTRKLKPEARPLPDSADSIISPADGFVSEIGRIEANRLIQAKHKHYSLNELLAGETEWSAAFENGHFITVYLAPHNYHRVHMPFEGQLTQMVHVPGKLFSVNLFTADHIDNLFGRNERVICHFDTAFGPMIVVLVGALFVAGIHTAWHGKVTPPTRKTITRFDYRDQQLTLGRGDELGMFEFGSTAIVLFPPDAVNLTQAAHSPIHFGSEIGKTVNKPV